MKHLKDIPLYLMFALIVFAPTWIGWCCGGVIGLIIGCVCMPSWSWLSLQCLDILADHLGEKAANLRKYEEMKKVYQNKFNKEKQYESTDNTK